MLTIEKLTEKDLPEVIETENISFSNPWSEKQFIDSINNFYAAKLDRKTVGFIGIELIADEAHLLHMAVHPDFRRRGIAKKLVEFMLSFKVKKWFLEVRAGNLAAQKLYEGFGFKTISRRKKYYQDNDEDALIMELVI